MKKTATVFLIALLLGGVSYLFGAQLTVDDTGTYATPKAMIQAIDTMFTELYGKWTSLGTDHDTGAELDALYEAELNNSAGLAAALSDETGTGVSVFSTSPTLVTPALGTPSSGDLSNCTNAQGVSEAYDSTNWDGDGGAATKNDVRDKIETLSGGHDAVTIGTANGLSLSTQELSLAAATNSSAGAATAAQITALEAIDTEAELEALLELQDLQGAVTDAQVPNDITITESDPNVDSSSEIATILNTTPSTLIDEEVLQQPANNCGAIPGSPIDDKEYCIDGSVERIDSVWQGNDKWLCRHNASLSDWVCYWNLTDGTRIENEICFPPVIYAQPDALQGEADAWPIMDFPAESYPNGFTLTAVHFYNSSTCTDTINLEEWSNNGTSWTVENTVESITLSGVHTEDDGTFEDAEIAADSSLYGDFDDSTTDHSNMRIVVCGRPGVAP